MSVRRLAPALVAVTLAACQAEEAVAPQAVHQHPAAVKVDEVHPAELAALRRAIGPYHNVKAAERGGWNFVIPNLDGSLCFESSAGGMGFHYADPALIGDGVVDAGKPEALLFEPQKNGRLRLVAVEYLVPIALWTGAEPPRLYGREFPEVPGFGVYGLHVWIGKENPEGLFTAYNPTVSCAYAAATN
jgi:hypothetical protein